MPYNRPIPDSERRHSKLSSGIDTLVQAEKMMQIAMLLPCSTLIGWGVGAWLDSKLGLHWLGIAGMIFGGISGLVYVIRLVMSSTGESKTKKGKASEL